MLNSTATYTTTDQSDNISVEVTHDVISPNQPDPVSAVVRACAMYRVAILGILLGVITIGGIIANFLAGFTMWPQRKKQATAILIIALASFDALFLSICVLNVVLPNLARYYQDESLGVYMKWVHPYSYVYIHPLARMGHYASTWTLLAITFHR